MNSRKTVEERLDGALGSAPEFHLSPDFADRVLRKVEQRSQITERQYVYTVLGTTLFFLVSSAICFAVFIDRTTLLRLMDFAGWGTLALLLVTTIQVLDRKLVRRTEILSGS